MRGIIRFLFFYLAVAFFSPVFSFSQTGSARNYFGEQVFIENKGQFDGWVRSSLPVQYATNNSDKIFFTKQGLVFRLDKADERSEHEREEQARREGAVSVIETEVYYVNMKWEGCNENPYIEVSEIAEGYYTFGEKGFEDVEAKGYKKLVYKELYPGIDAEYVIPAKGGIKYALIIHPGADAGRIRMKYSGDVDGIEISKEGNVLIKTPAGVVVDHAPLSYYKASSQKIGSDFSLDGNLVRFKLNGSDPLKLKQETIVIDPWTVTPSSLASNSAAFDIDYDNYGNVYVSGGTNPHKLSKLSSTGTILWTFTNPISWGMYTKFCLLRKGGAVFIGQGFSTLSTTSVMKIRPTGTLQFTSAPFTGTCEIWRMFYNSCTGQLIGFGGGVNNPNSLQLISDTNLTSSSAKNFNGYGNPSSCCNDIASVDMDDNGDFYALMSSQSGIPAVNNRLMKSLTSSSYNPPCAFDVATGYAFEEATNNGIPGFGGQTTVRANAVSINATYLFTYDGRTLIAWNKTTGANLASVIVNASYAGGKNRVREGIDVDECNNVYVGGSNQVHVYLFNGTAFTAGTSLTSTVTGPVYDVCLGPMNKLYVCGAGFVSELQLSTAGCNQISIVTSSQNANCNSPTGSATVTPSGGTAPYTYLWNPGGQTTATATGLTPGSYTVTVTDASPSCNPNESASTAMVSVSSAGSFSITSTQVNPGCNGGSDGSGTVSITGGSAPYTYSWLPSGGTTAVATGLSAMSYTVIVTDGSGCSSTQTFSITEPAGMSATVTSTQSSCGSNTGTASVIVSGGAGTYTYNWTPGGQATATATGLGSGMYTAIITDANGCTKTQTVIVGQPSTIASTATATSTPCGSSNGVATVVVTGGAAPYTYNWTPGGQATATATGLGAGIYSAVVTDGAGCTTTASVIVGSTGGPVANISADVTIAQGQNTTLAAGGGGSYTWSTGENTSQIIVAPTLTTIYCVTVTDTGNCSDTACVTVFVDEIDCTPSVTGQLFMPNAFSPNNDGENDVINIYFGNMNCIKTFELAIYDRWGAKVFETTSPVAQWDGNYKGEPMGTAVFAYYMKAVLITGDEIVKKGNISLVR